MGILRIFLAYIVLLSHAPEGIILKKISHPALAVQCFYSISGFYIQLLIRKFEGSGSRWSISFYKNRLLRITPTYYLCLIMTCILVPSHLYSYMNSDFYHQIIFILNNLLIIPQDIIYFFSDNNYTVMGVSWTLSLEMMFYIISPYLLTKKNSELLLVVFLSILIRFYLRDHDHYTQIWFYRFFPSEISIFVCGALSYRFYQNYMINTDSKFDLFFNIIGLLTLIYLIYMFVSGWNHINGGHWELEGKTTCGVPIKYWYMLALTIISLPFIFKWSKNIKFDLYIGEFSYAIYLGHFMIIEKLSSFMSDKYLNVVVLFITLILAYFITEYIEIPLARFRRSMKCGSIKHSQCEAVKS